MIRALRKNGFNDITTCVDHEATRDGILKKWKQLICRTMPGDAVAFYYSGHGALVKSGNNDDEKRSPLRSLQFIVPMDYDGSNSKDFKGILDVEISDFLWEITRKTKNVTVILDCCHSGRMARNPKLGSRSSPRFLLGVQYHDLDPLVRKFEQNTPLDAEGYPEGNPFTVRIVAGTQGETAWEHEDQEGKWQGALTRALGKALEESAGKSISWHMTMIRVRDILTASNCPQHPMAEGPSKRIHFTLEESDPGVFNFHSQGQIVTIEGGRIAGFLESDVFALLPHGSEPRAAWHAKARLSSVHAFESRGEIFGTRGSGEVLENGVAVLIERALRPSPIQIPPNMMKLRQAIEASEFLRVSTRDDTEKVPYIRLEGDSVALYDEDSIEVFCSPKEEPGQICSAAERLIRAKLFRTLKPEISEKLVHNLDIHFDIVGAGQGRAISPSGTSHVTQNERACIRLDNRGRSLVHVSIFDVNVAGEIFLLNTDSPGGIEIEGDSSYVYGKNKKVKSGNKRSRRRGFGVVSIFVRAEERLFIENDKVLVGATAIFTNQPDLDIITYENYKHEMWLSTKPTRLAIE
ncbi:hypothetical protein B0A48_02021 [Cryoendolithus antarcticus]|uniref:Peptidase C14 caspase domain-containing protein n=1 Tax=Cryoendolithus antarcticus TaxID=1507870 RepID=A0A1V8TR06_9PEZI|nr:hypothetical protein B0A48_02021 [Cryoendolithus antarcticus]